MKITPIASPAQVPNTSTPEASRSAKAIAAFNAGQSTYDSNPGQTAQDAQRPQVNANAISAEELSAVKGQQSQEVSDENVELEDTVEAQGEETTEEVVVEEPKKPVDTPESRRFAQLARQEKALRAKQHQQDLAFKQREQALIEREAKLNGVQQTPAVDMSKYISVDQFKADPLSVMQQTGLTYEELTSQILNQQPENPRVNATISRLEAKIASLEAKAEESVKQVSAQQQQAYDAAVKQIATDAKALISHDPAFETIKATNSINDVVELITETYNKDGVLLTIEEAAQQVEDYLIEEAMKITRIGKIKQRLEQAVQPVKAGTQTPKPTQTQAPSMKTLTNATSSTRKLSSRERALLAFKGEKF